MNMAMEGTLDGQVLPTQDIPPMQFGMSLAIGDVTDERIDTTFEYSDVSVSEGGDPATAATLEQTLDDIEGVEGTLSTTPSGQLLEAELNLPDDIDPALGSFAGQIEDQFRSITVPFPEEPVGVGAVWTVDTEIELSGVISQLEATYKLDKLRGDAYQLTVEMDQTVGGGEIEGAPGEILGGESLGHAQIKGRLDSLFPIRSKATTDGSTRIEVPVEDGDPQEVEQDVTVDLTFSSPAGRAK